MSLFKSEKFHSIAFLTIISALVYLPLVAKLGYTHDDWYLMYAAKVKGISIFHTIFAEDRPMRAFVMMPFYLAFGENSLYYNLASYFFRLLSGISFLWALRLVWVKEKAPTFLMALFFLIYPGFLSHPNGVDYLSHQVALAFAPLSIALSLKAFLSEKKWQRILFFLLSVVFGGIYLGQMEYYIGLESLRFALLFVLLWRKEGKWLPKAWRTIWQSIPFLLASFPFLYWRLFIFESTRGATDTNKQLSSFLSDPLRQLFLWGTKLFEDVIKVLFGAWVTPFKQFYQYNATLFNSVIFLLIALTLAGLSYIGYRHFSKNGGDKIKATPWQREALLAGAFSLIICQIPIIMVNRQVSFPVYSRYALPGSLGAVIVLVALLYFLRPEFLRKSFFVLLVIIAALTHNANAKKFAKETEVINNFWWQVSWRVPSMEIETTLLANYPLVVTEEDYFIWGPASQIYYAEGISKQRVRPGVYAAVLNEEAVQDIFNGEGEKYRNRRGIVTYANYQKILVLSQPSTSSCVHVIDGTQPTYSGMENERIMQIGGYSDAGLIQTDADPHTPPEIVFGPEPAHDWCYIYQTATLARQKGDWELVAALDTEASEKGSVPQDPVEWLPFIQASAMLGDGERVRDLASSLENEPFIRQQACESLRRMELTSEMRALAEDSYCIEK